MALKAHKTQHFPGKRAIIRGNPPAVHDRKGPKASNFIEFYKKQTLQPVARHVAADPSTSGREVAVVVKQDTGSSPAVPPYRMTALRHFKKGNAHVIHTRLYSLLQ
jgi:hypothetical protein